MALEKRVVDIPIVGGVEGNTEGPLKTRLNVLENGVYRKRKGVSKRYGTRRLSTPDTVAIGSTTAPPAPESLAAYRNECLRFGKGQLHTYTRVIDTGSNGRRVYVDQCSEVTGTYSGVATSVVSYLRPDVAIGSGFIIYVYQDDSGATSFGNVFVTIIDATTGATIQDRYQLSSDDSFANPRVAVVSTKAIVVYGRDDGDIMYRSLDLASPGNPPTWTSETALKSDAYLADAPMYDLCVFDTSGLIPSPFVLVFAHVHDTGSGLEYRLSMLNTSLVEIATGTSAATAAADASCIAVTADATRIWLAYSHDDGGNAITGWSVFDSVPFAGSIVERADFSTPVAMFTGTGDADQSVSIGLAILPSNPTTCAVMATQYDGHVWAHRVFDDATEYYATRTVTAGKYRLVSRLWAQDSKIFGIVEHTPGGGSRGSLEVIETGSTVTGSQPYQVRPVCTLVPRQTGDVGGITAPIGALPPMVPLCSVVANGTNAWVSVVGMSLFDGAASLGAIYGLSLTFNEPRQVAEANGIALLSGGVPSIFDGSTVAEVGFLEVPEALSLGDAGAGNLSAGAYQYILVREWTDARGNVHRSAPGPEASITLAASHKTTVTVPHLGMTTKQDNESGFSPHIANVLYRTKAGTPGVFYRLTPIPPAISDLNLPLSTSPLSYEDNISDASLDDNPQIYVGDITNGAGAILDNVCPPSARYVHAHKNRFWLAGTDEDTIWYSKTLLSFEGPAFNEALTIQAFDGGRVTALATLDGALVIFKRGSIWLVEGDGHDDTGNNSTLTEPRRVSSDAGCIDFRTVAVIPEGLMFQSERGIYLLSRALDVTFVGEDVADKTQASGAYLTSAVVVPTQNQVRFSRALTGAQNGLWDVLVYDYLNRAWSVFRYHDAWFAAQRGAQGACLINGVYTYVTPDGQEYEENTGTYLDLGTTWVTMRVQTAWIPLSGSLQGSQRVWRAGILAERASAHGVTLTVDVDYDQANPQTATFTEATVTALGTVEQLEIRPVKQRCTAIRLKFEDSAPAVLGSGQGASLDAVSLEYGVLPGKGRRLAASQKG